MEKVQYINLAKEDYMLDNTPLITKDIQCTKRKMKK